MPASFLGGWVDT